MFAFYLSGISVLRSLFLKLWNLFQLQKIKKAYVSNMYLTLFLFIVLYIFNENLSNTIYIWHINIYNSYHSVVTGTCRSHKNRGLSPSVLQADGGCGRCCSYPWFPQLSVKACATRVSLQDLSFSWGGFFTHHSAARVHRAALSQCCQESEAVFFLIPATEAGRNGGETLSRHRQWESALKIRAKTQLSSFALCSFTCLNTLNVVWLSCLGYSGISGQYIHCGASWPSAPPPLWQQSVERQSFSQHSHRPSGSLKEACQGAGPSTAAGAGALCVVVELGSKRPSSLNIHQVQQLLPVLTRFLFKGLCFYFSEP